jgi:peptide deformylase
VDLEALMTRGTVRPITRWSEPVLHSPCRPVVAFDDDLHNLVADMWATMAAAEGVGLAAPQIGVDLAVFVYDCPDEHGEHRRGVMCNPVLTLPQGPDRHLEESDEGCLSLPGAFADLARPDRATCRGQDQNGDEVEISGSGFLARCLQHETDHLHGTVFGDRLPRKARARLLRDHEALADSYPPEWPAIT